jgi:glycosyltransferase involved in cell wall biosynthesis
MRVAIVHYWLVSMRGGEKVVEALSDLFPTADIFTLVLDEKAISDKLRRHNIHTSFLQRIPGAVKHYQSLLPLMPYALEHLDMSRYDLVISSESGPAKGVIPQPDATHVCYCHSPMRYIWDHYHQYRSTKGLLARTLMPIFAPALRQWDVTTAARVDQFVANSTHVAQRIARFYRRDATIIPPPVDIDAFAPSDAVDDFYLCAGQLVGYKRVDLAVEAFTRMGKRLVVIGEGEDRSRLEALAGPTVTFLGRAPFEVLRESLARCRALVFPGEEDFGIVPVEAMASGRPVLAYGRGGAIDTVIPGVLGLTFEHQTVEDLVAVVERFEREEVRFDPLALRRHAASFDVSVFKRRMRALVDNALAAHARPPTEEVVAWPQLAPVSLAAAPLAAIRH